MKEETELKPKPLIEIGARPILWHIMRIYAHYGFKEFILCVGYKGAMIKEYLYHYHFLMNDFTIKLGTQRQVDFHSRSQEADWKITVVDTGIDTLKGARIKMVEKFITGDKFLLTYGDGVADVNINALVEFHQRQGRIATLTGVRPPSRFGDLVAKEGKVLRFTEKPQASGGLINGGFFVFDRKFLSFLSDDRACDFENGALEMLAKKGQLSVYNHKGSWECMDTLRDVENLNSLWSNHRAFWKVWK